MDLRRRTINNGYAGKAASCEASSDVFQKFLLPKSTLEATCFNRVSD